MAVNEEQYKKIIDELNDKATLVAVSKTKPVEDIKALYDLGQRHFAENYVQELLAKQPQLPQDIQWHFIGHLQSNKVKQIVPFVHLIHSADSLKLLQEINKQAAKLNKTMNVLLQVHIAKEETKFGFDEHELEMFFEKNEVEELHNISIDGLMGMSSLTDDTTIVKKEFQQLKSLFDKYNQFNIQSRNIGTAFKILSMGMSSDYTLAVACGSNMVRIGSLLFGARNYSM